MTLMDIIIKLTIFFGIFYGAIAITAVITKKFRKEEESKFAETLEKESTDETKPKEDTK